MTHGLRNPRTLYRIIDVFATITLPSPPHSPTWTDQHGPSAFGLLGGSTYSAQRSSQLTKKTDAAILVGWTPRGDTLINAGGAVVQVDLRRSTTFLAAFGLGNLPPAFRIACLCNRFFPGLDDRLLAGVIGKQSRCSLILFRHRRSQKEKPLTREQIPKNTLHTLTGRTSVSRVSIAGATLPM